jgi:hypothetical protein
MAAVYFDQQETVEFPQWMRDLGFEDRSWRNDAAAYTTLGDVACWVAEVDPAEREFSEDGDRFYCWAGINADDPTNAEGCKLIYKGEDEAAFRVALQSFLTPKVVA